MECLPLASLCENWYPAPHTIQNHDEENPTDINNAGTRYIELSRTDATCVTQEIGLANKATNGTDILQPDPDTDTEFEVENNTFAYTPGQLGRLYNPKSLSAFHALGGLEGLEKGLRTDRKSGLSIDEFDLLGNVTFEEATDQTRHDFKQVSTTARHASVSRCSIHRKASLSHLAWETYNDKVLVLLSVAATISLTAGLDEVQGRSSSTNKNGNRPFHPRKTYAPRPSVHRDWRIHITCMGVPIDALADTGANINVITASKARELGLDPDPGSMTDQRVRLPDGRSCATLGTTTLPIKFDGENEIHRVPCTILANSQDALILGYSFLKSSKTLTGFKNRLKLVRSTKKRIASLRLLEGDQRDSHLTPDKPKARVHGYLNGKHIQAVPDSGSDLMVISGACARGLGLDIDTSERTEITFVDGSTAMTSGSVNATWSFDLSGGIAVPKSCKWHVIEDLPVDAILSLDFIIEHDVFEKHQNAVVQTQHLSSHKVEDYDGDDVFGVIARKCGSKPTKDLAAEYIEDLRSTDPFSDTMRVRESARREQIQRSIASLPAQERPIHYHHERERMKQWSDMKALKDTGGNWSVLRDNIVSAVLQQSAPHPVAQPPAQVERLRDRLHWQRLWR